MKQFLTLSILALSLVWTSTPGWAQKRDTITLDRKGKKIQIEVMEEEQDSTPKKKITLGFEQDKKDNNFDPWKTRWILVDFGFSSYLYNGGAPSVNFEGVDGPINPMKQQIWGSWNVNFHLFKTNLSLYRNYLSIRSGLSFENIEYDFQNEVSMQPRTSDVTFNYTGRDYDENSLRSWYINVPLSLHVETNPDQKSRSFRFGVGGFVGLRLDTDLHEEFDIFDNRTDNDFNLNQFRYGVNAEIGYGWITLYGNLALNGLFDAGNNDVYDIMPINVGIQLISF
jgi:hypothetical protein